MIPDKLQTIFKDVFSVTFPITESLRRSDIPAWDSINHLNLIVELEEAFRVSFTAEEIESLDSVAKILAKIPA
jgi:acyl carrier protein